MKPYIFLLLILILVIPARVHSQTRISVSGNPVFPTTAFNLTEAGSDYSSSVTSTSGPYVSVTHKNGWGKFLGNFNWRVAINKSDILWNSLLELQVRRTGNGSGGSLLNNWISGGTNFQTVTNIPNTFFEGGAVRDNVPIEFRINNISVLIPADDYETTIYFTVYSQ